ncbi:hypothetical protein [Bartonella sp. MM73XJBT]|nr:hypothetical protein [Bartonella sp. MM73XJBT]
MLSATKDCSNIGTDKQYDGACFLLHKRKDDRTQWLYHYSIHGGIVK